MTIPSVLTPSNYQPNYDSSLKAEETASNTIAVETDILNSSDSTANQPDETSELVSPTSPLTKKPAETSDYQTFINDFVTLFLHPYITGQITSENEPNNRKSLVDALLEKMPAFEPSKKRKS